MRLRQVGVRIGRAAVVFQVRRIFAVDAGAEAETGR